MENINDIEEKSRVEILASRIELLFGFCKDLIPDIDLLEKAYAGARDRGSFAIAAAPILGAMGQDYDQVNFGWELKAKRAAAMINLLKTLRDTEGERQERNKVIASNQEAMRGIKEFLGI